MGWLLVLALAVYVGAHLSIAGGLAAVGRWKDAALAVVLPPLAPWWGWAAGMRLRVIIWGAALVLYAVGVATLHG